MRRRRRKEVREHLEDLCFNREFYIIMGLPPTRVVHITCGSPSYCADWFLIAATANFSMVTVKLGLLVM